MNFSRNSEGVSRMTVKPAPIGFAGLGRAVMGGAILCGITTSNLLAEGVPAESIVLQVERLSPQVRTLNLEEEVLTISPDVIAPFMGHPVLMDELVDQPSGRVLVGLNGEIMFGQFSEFIAEDVPFSESGLYTIFRPDREVRHPLSGETLATKALVLGIARQTQSGEIATFEVIRGEQEIGIGDRLVPWQGEASLDAITPAIPGAALDINVYVVSTLSAVGGAGSYSVVIISEGESAGVQVGDLFTVKTPERQLLFTEREAIPVRTTSACGSSRESLLVSSGRIMECAERTPSRRELAGRSSEVVPLPETISGELLVFRVFDRVSFALVRKASRAIQVGDWVGSPGG
ncbi:MAG: hypothetical protein EBZ14_01730 [Gammaproteobacteria bacterium]|jgi:hypothetical protein|nr:hypothetical protein [Gammaproteobacteria bacterium]